MRPPLLLFLEILKPVFTFPLGSLALIGVLMSFFWLSIGVPHFPFVLMLGLSLGVGATRVAYHVLMRLPTRWSPRQR